MADECSNGIYTLAKLAVFRIPISKDALRALLDIQQLYSAVVYVPYPVFRRKLRNEGDLTQQTPFPLATNGVSLLYRYKGPIAKHITASLQHQNCIYANLSARAVQFLYCER